MDHSRIGDLFVPIAQVAKAAWFRGLARYPTVARAVHKVGNPTQETHFMTSLKRLFGLLALACATSLGWAGCGSGDGATTGDDDEITSTKCKIVNVKEGRPMAVADLKKLNDPIAKFVLGGAKGA